MKKYLIHHPKGEFKLYVSQVGNNDVFIATFAYYLEQGSFIQGTDVEIHAEAQHFTDKSEKGAYDQSVVWIELNLGDNYKIERLS